MHHIGNGSLERLVGFVERDVNVSAGLVEFLAHVGQPFLLFRKTRSMVTDILRDFHGAELRSAHGAEMGRLVRILRKRLVVIRAGRFGIERQVELVFPAEFKARA